MNVEVLRGKHLPTFQAMYINTFGLLQLYSNKQGQEIPVLATA